MGETHKDALRVYFDRSVKLEFHGSTISSDGGLPAYRERDEVFTLTLTADDMTDLRAGSNVQHRLTGLHQPARWPPSSRPTCSRSRRIWWRG